jgi:hypothetical protein
MMAKSVKRISKAKKKQLPGTIDKSVGNYENDPFFVKKTQEVKARLEKMGLSEKLAKKK